MRHIDLTNAFPFPDPSHTHVPLRFFAQFPLYSTRRLVGLKPAGPRSTSCLVSTLLFLSQHSPVHLTTHCTFQQDPRSTLSGQGRHTFFESDLGLITESDATPFCCAAVPRSCRTVSKPYETCSTRQITTRNVPITPHHISIVDHPPQYA